MQNSGTFNPAKPLISQAERNTNLWIGHLQNDPQDHLAGQTFTCPTSGLINNIQVYTAAVHSPGSLELTLHEFDSDSRKWGAVICQSAIELERNDEKRWIRFELPAVPLQGGMSYGFQLSAPNAMVALGEAATGTHHPFTFGHEWNGNSPQHTGVFYSYFSLAFKVEMCA